MPVDPNEEVLRRLQRASQPRGDPQAPTERTYNTQNQYMPFDPTAWQGARGLMGEIGSMPGQPPQDTGQAYNPNAPRAGPTPESTLQGATPQFPPVVVPGEPEQMPTVLPDRQPGQQPPPVPMPGGGIDPDTFNNLFGQAFQTAFAPIQEQLTGFEQQLQGLQQGQPQTADVVSQILAGIPGVDLSGIQSQLSGLQEGVAGIQPTDLSGILAGQAGLQESITGLPAPAAPVDLSALEGGIAGLQESIGNIPSVDLSGIQSGIEGLQTLISQQAGGQPTGLTPEQLQTALETFGNTFMNQMQGQFTQPLPESVEGAGPAAGEGAAPVQMQLTPEQLESIFGGTGDASQMPGFMYGPDFFRSYTDYMTETAGRNPAAEIQGIMGDVLGAGPASMGELGKEFAGMIRSLPETRTDTYQQRLDQTLARLGEEERRAMEAENLRLNQLGLYQDGQASGGVLPSRLDIRERFGQLRGELGTNLLQQEAQREDALRQAQIGGMGGLLGLQQTGQGQTFAGLSDLARSLQESQAQQIGAMGGISGQAWQQNVEDIGLQNLFAQQEQQRKNQLLNTLLGQTSPTGQFNIPFMPNQQGEGGGDFWSFLGQSLPYALMLL